PMNKFIAMAALLTLLAIPTKSWSQTKPAPNPSANQMQAPEQSSPAAFKTAQGALSRVDNAKQTLWIKGADGKEQEFKYNAQTQVTGGDNTVEGLAKMNGTQLKIQYEVVDGANNAVKIDIQSAKG